MYDDYDDFDNYDVGNDFGDYDDYLDDFDDFGEYEDFLNDYENQLMEFELQEEDARDIYETRTRDMDEYWDGEERYLRESGIYTEEELKQVLSDLNESRREQKEQALADYEMEKSFIQDDREMLEIDRELAEDEREWRMEEKQIELETERMELEAERREMEEARRASMNRSYHQPQKPSFFKNLITSAAIYHFLRKIF